MNAYHQLQRDIKRANEILEEVGEESGHTVEELKSDCKRKSLSLSRQHAMHKIYTTTGLSSTDVGHIFNRDHTTVLYAVRKMNAG